MPATSDSRLKPKPPNRKGREAYFQKVSSSSMLQLRDAASRLISSMARKDAWLVDVSYPQQVALGTDEYLERKKRAARLPMLSVLSMSVLVICLMLSRPKS